MCKSLSLVESIFSLLIMPFLHGKRVTKLSLYCATHQYSNHDQSYVPDARLEEGRSIRDVDAGAGTPFADLVSHI